jgi:hypothetical protein
MLGKIYDAAIGVKTRNGKGRATGFNSTIISFNTNEVLKLNQYVSLSLEGKTNWFQINAININEDTSFDVEAHEVGYYNMLHKKDNFDMRILLQKEVDLVTDKDVISRIVTESCYC